LVETGHGTSGDIVVVLTVDSVGPNVDGDIQRGDGLRTRVGDGEYVGGGVAPCSVVLDGGGSSATVVGVSEGGDGPRYVASPVELSDTSDGQLEDVVNGALGVVPCVPAYGE